MRFVVVWAFLCDCRPRSSNTFTGVCLALASRGLRSVQQPAQRNEHRPCLAAFPRRCALMEVWHPMADGDVKECLTFGDVFDCDFGGSK